jgi:SpoVK/Ycf46/Vps4 family AAA+-type ATPase
VRDAHDRYANVEVAYLLQRMEAYDGIAILATNLRQNMDEAFLRRLGAVIQFPLPDEEGRRQLWAKVWPRPNLLGPDVDLEALAHDYRLSGSTIHSAALAAAFSAAERGGLIAMGDIVEAVQREFQKQGRVLP